MSRTPSTLPEVQDIAFLPTDAARHLPDGALRVYFALVAAGAEGQHVPAPMTAIARWLGYVVAPRTHAPIAIRRRLLDLEARGYASRLTRGGRVLWRVWALPLPKEHRTHA